MFEKAATKTAKKWRVLWTKEVYSASTSTSTALCFEKSRLCLSYACCEVPANWQIPPVANSRLHIQLSGCVCHFMCRVRSVRSFHVNPQCTQRFGNPARVGQPHSGTGWQFAWGGGGAMATICAAGEISSLSLGEAEFGWIWTEAMATTGVTVKISWTLAEITCWERPTCDTGFADSCFCIFSMDACCETIWARWLASSWSSWHLHAPCHPSLERVYFSTIAIFFCVNFRST